MPFVVQREGLAILNDEEKVRILVRAIERADAMLEWTENARTGSEWAMTTVKRVRRILRAALKKTKPKKEQKG